MSNLRARPKVPDPNLQIKSRDEVTITETSHEDETTQEAKEEEAPAKVVRPIADPRVADAEVQMVDITPVQGIQQASMPQLTEGSETVQAICKNGHEYVVPKYMLAEKKLSVCHCGEPLKEKGE